MSSRPSRPPAGQPGPGILRRSRRLVPFLLLAPGLVWLVVFYAYPALQVFLSSFWSGTLETGYAFSLDNWTVYPRVIDRFGAQLGRSLVYGMAATLLCFMIGFPLAHAIAFRAGRYRNVLLFLVVAPLFTSFLLRTIGWKLLAADGGLVLGTMKASGLLEPDFRILATPLAVILGITYNFVPFMTLPIYVSLERMDRQLLEAAQDLYAGPWRPGGTVAGLAVGGAIGGFLGFAIGAGVALPALAGAALGTAVGTFLVSQSFLRVTAPLAIPGVFAGTLLTFIPAVGDYVNQTLLGNPGTTLVGNVIQARYLTSADFPTAAALSFILLAGILVAVALYARLLGTEELTAARL